MMTEEKQVYLSRLILNQRSKEVQRDLADCQRLHCRLMKGFPDNLTAEERAQLRILHRVDFDRRKNRLTVLVQSRKEPDWGKLPPDYLADEVNNPACQSADESYNTLREGVRLIFRLRANPTRKIDTKDRPDGSKSNGKRVEIRGEEKQLDWLRRKGDQHGFRLLAARINPDVLNARANPEGKAIGWRDRSHPPMKFGSALFEGELEITDAERFRQSLFDGVGSGKAYGFGLLSIAPIGAGGGVE